MITLEMIQQTQQTTKCILEVVFKYEKSFKADVLGGKRCVGWEDDEYSIEFCHAATNWRITLKHDDGREKDIFIPCGYVHSWFIKLQDKEVG